MNVTNYKEPAKQYEPLTKLHWYLVSVLTVGDLNFFVY